MSSDPDEQAVCSPDGREWHVRRDWLLAADPPETVEEDSGWGYEFLGRLGARIEPFLTWRTVAFGIVLVAVVAAIAILLGAPTTEVIIVAVVVVGAVPMAIFAFDVAVFVVLGPVVVIAAVAIPLYYALRILRGKPWTLEAVCVGPPRTTISWEVRGWRRSGEAVHEIRQALAAGDFGFRPIGASGSPEITTAESSIASSARPSSAT